MNLAYKDAKLWTLKGMEVSDYDLPGQFPNPYCDQLRLVAVTDIHLVHSLVISVVAKNLSCFGPLIP